MKNLGVSYLGINSVVCKLQIKENQSDQTEIFSHGTLYKFKKYNGNYVFI